MEWYEKFKDLNWSIQNVNTLFDSNIFPFNILTGNTGCHYIIIQKAYLNVPNIEKPILIQELNLSENNIRELIFFLGNFVESHSINFWTGEIASNSIAAVLTSLSKGTTPIGIAGGSLWNLISNEVNSNVVPIVILKSLVTQGGNYTTTIQVKKGDGTEGSFLYCDVSYSIQIGTEKYKRKFPLLTFIMPFIVRVSTFYTKGEFNNKRIQSTTATSYSWIDQDTNKQEKLLTYISQDRDYYYFVNSTDINEKYRISLWGGSLDKYRESFGKYVPLYSNTSSE